MKKSLKRIISVAVCAVMIAVLFASCGSSNKYYEMGASDSFIWTDEMDFDLAEGFYEAEAPMNSAAYSPMEPVKATNTSQSSDAIKASERKIIKNKTMTCETLDYDAFIADITTRVTAFGGYIENSTQNGNTYYSKSLRSASYKIRIPAERFEEFTSLIGDIATVTYTYEYVDDVTAAYVDIEARLASLRAEQESFLKLMDRAETIEEILKVQSYLTDVNYQIESFTAQLNSYKSLVSYSTLNLDVREVERITPIVTTTPGVFERIKANLSENLYDISEGFKDAFVYIVSSAPYLLILAVLVIVGVVIAKIVIKKHKKSEAAAAMQKAASENKESK